MADGVQVSSNINDVLKDLAAWREDVAVRTVRGSVRRCAKRATDMLRPVVPVFTGKLRFNLKVAGVKYSRNRGVVTSKVAVSTEGKAENQKNAFYWRFVEFGHKTRPSKSGNGTQSEVAPQNFIQSASARINSAVAAIFFSDLERAVNRAGKKVGLSTENR